jgi:hypothetical protein
MFIEKKCTLLTTKTDYIFLFKIKNRAGRIGQMLFYLIHCRGVTIVDGIAGASRRVVGNRAAGAALRIGDGTGARRVRRAAIVRRIERGVERRRAAVVVGIVAAYGIVNDACVRACVSETSSATCTRGTSAYHQQRRPRVASSCDASNRRASDKSWSRSDTRVDRRASSDSLSRPAAFRTRRRRRTGPPGSPACGIGRCLALRRAACRCHCRCCRTTGCRLFALVLRTTAMVSCVQVRIVGGRIERASERASYVANSNV